LNWFGLLFLFYLFLVLQMSSIILPASHLPSYLGDPVDHISSLSGLPSDQLRLLFCLIAAVPIGWIQTFIKSTTIKHLIATIVGAFFSWFVVGNSAWVR
jgi:hypothetical protein